MQSYASSNESSPVPACSVEDEAALATKIMNVVDKSQ
jgi:hypothetical protein